MELYVGYTKGGVCVPAREMEHTGTLSSLPYSKRILKRQLHASDCLLLRQSPGLRLALAHPSESGHEYMILLPLPLR